MGAAGGIAKSCPVCGRLVPVQLGADRTEVSIVVPVYNEGDQIARNAATIRFFALQTINSANVPVDFNATDPAIVERARQLSDENTAQQRQASANSAEKVEAEFNPPVQYSYDLGKEMQQGPNVNR